MSTPSSTGGQGHEAPEPRRDIALGKDGLALRRPRPSVARVLVVALLSIIATALLFRLAVEAMRRLLAA